MEMLQLIKDTPQVLTSWGLQKGLIVVTTSSNKDRLAQTVQMARSSEALLTPQEIYAIDTAGLRLSHREFWKKEFGV